MSSFPTSWEDGEEAEDVVDEEFLVIKEEPQDLEDYDDFEEEGDYSNSNHDLDPDIDLKDLARATLTCSFPTCDNRKFRNQASLAAHIKHSHSASSSFQCHICNEQLSSAKTLKAHLATHVLKEKPGCPTCLRTYSTGGQLRLHMKSHLSLKELMRKGIPFWTCYFCGKREFTYSRLEYHFSKHTKEKPFKCHLCQKSYVSSTGLIAHNHEVHLRDAHKLRESWKYDCPHCGRKFRALSTLQIHLPRHSDEKGFTCTDCGKAFKFRPELVAHVKIHEDVCKHECGECGYRATSAWKLKHHSYTHSNEKPYGCEECPTRFRQKSALIKHVEKFHQGETKRPWECGVCKKRFIEKSNLKAHSLLHQLEEAGWTCEICGKKLATEKRLAAHTATHSGRKDFACPFPGCGKNYTEIGNLRRHQRATHEGMRRACDVEGCDKSFTGPMGLKSHKSSAHGIGPSVPCGVKGCGWAFPDKTRLAQHMKAVHKVGEMEFKCPRKGCRKAFGLRGYLTHHMKSFHKLNWVYDKESKSWVEGGKVM